MQTKCNSCERFANLSVWPIRFDSIVEVSLFFWLIESIVWIVLRRLLPAFLLTMAIIYSLQFIGQGPLFHRDLVKPYVEPCKMKFFHHLFLVHNFLSPTDRVSEFHCLNSFPLIELSNSVAHIPGTLQPIFIFTWPHSSLFSWHEIWNTNSTP